MFSNLSRSRFQLQAHLWWLSLLLLTAVTYWPVRSYEFVNWDDPWYVVHNEYLRSWSPGNLKAIATDVINRNYSPVIIFTLLIEYTLFGLEPAGYHVVNVLLHAVCAILTGVLITQLSGDRRIGWFTAALFAVHPVQIESVAWISSIKGLVSGVFILAHLICWMRPERTARQELWGLFFFVAALLAKSLTVVVPAIVLLYDLMICRKKFTEALARQIIPGVLSLWMLLTTMSAQTTSLGGVRDHMHLSKGQILAVDALILRDYVRMLVWPRGLSVMYDVPVSGIAGEVALTSLGWIVVSAGLWRIRRRHPLIVLAAASFLLLLIPVLNLTPITTLMNDRYLYLPCIPFFAVLSAGMLRLLEHCRRPRRSEMESTTSPARLWLSAGAVLGVLLVASRLHLPVWRNDRSLWEHAMRHAPNLPLVRIQYALMLNNEGRSQEAVQVLEDTLVQLQPDPLDEERIREKIHLWTARTSAGI